MRRLPSNSNPVLAPIFPFDRLFVCPVDRVNVSFQVFKPVEPL